MIRRAAINDDPEFYSKGADFTGLHLTPRSMQPCSAGDEKTPIQALDRLGPVLLLSPGRAPGFEYLREGTLSLYAALNVKTGIGEG